MSHTSKVWMRCLRERRARKSRCLRRAQNRKSRLPGPRGSLTVELLEQRALLSATSGIEEPYSVERLESDANYAGSVLTAFLPSGRDLSDLAAELHRLDLPHQDAYSQAANIVTSIVVGESESNNTPATANPVPLGFDLSEHVAVDVTGNLDPGLGLAGTAQNVDGAGWSLTANDNIESSTLLPHVSVEATGDGTFDYYSFTVANAGDQGIFDLDFHNFNTELFLYDLDGNLLVENEDSGIDPGSSNLFGSLINYTFADSGTYFIGVGEADSVSSGGRLSGNVPDDRDAYTLHLSIQNHVLSTGDTGPIAEVESNHPLQDVDTFAIELEPGDIFGANVNGGGTRVILRAPDGSRLIRSKQDATFAHPAASPLPGGGNAALSYVIDTAGTYTIAVDQGVDDYTLNLRVFRPELESQLRNSRQILYLDFDGASIDAEQLFGGGNANAELSPLSSFLADWGLDASHEDAVIDAILATLEENFADIGLSGNNGDRTTDGVDGHYQIEILNSRDHSDLFGFPINPFGEANVSRVIVGGTIPELGINTIGIAESIDVGNFETEESAVVLLDVLSSPTGNPDSLNSYPIATGANMVGLIGAAVGNLAAHEAGHFFANWHTFLSFPWNLMDQGGYLPAIIGLGPDEIFGSRDDRDVDFGVDIFPSNEGFVGIEDTLNSIAFGLSTGTVDPGMVVVGSNPADNEQLLTILPTDFVIDFIDPYDPITVHASDLLVNGIQADSVSLTDENTLTFHYTASPVVTEGLQTLEMSVGAVARSSDGDETEAFAADFGFDALLMQIVSTDLPEGLLVELPLVSLTINLNEAYGPASVGTDDLVLSQGSVIGFNLLDDNSIEYLLDGIVSEERLTVDMADGALVDVYGNLGLGFSSSYDLDFGQVLFPKTLDPVLPLGSLIYEQSVSGTIGESDTDSFAISVDPGQTITVVVNNTTNVDFSASQTQANLIYPPFVLTYEFDVSDAPTPVSGGRLDISAIADLNTNAEFLTLDAEGIFSLDLFVNDGDQLTPIKTTVDLTQADLAALAADGTITFTLTPSEDVDNLGPNSLTLNLSFSGVNIFQPRVDLSHQGHLVSSAVAAAPTENVVLQTIPTRGRIEGSHRSPQTYVVTIGGAGGSIGGYNVQIILNSAVEEERGGGHSNGTLADAQDLASSFISLFSAGSSGPSRFKPERGAVLGQIDEIESPALLVNGSFESGGFTGWTVATTGSPYPSKKWTVSETNLGTGFGLELTQPQAGSFIAWNGFDGPGPMEFTMFQDVAIPADAPSATLEWTDRVQWNFYESRNFASLPRLYDVEVRDPVTGVLLDTLSSLSTGTEDVTPVGNSGFQTHSVDISEFIGQTVRVQFREQVPEFFTGPAQFEIDNIRLDIGEEPPPDFYSFKLRAGERATLALTALAGHHVEIDLLDANGNFLEYTPLSSQQDAIATNVNDLIKTFVARASGVYFARVHGSPGVEYSLVVTRNADFSLEDNNGIESAQVVERSRKASEQWVLGAIDASIPETLFGSSRIGQLFSIDLSSASGTLVGNLPIETTEIEHDNFSGRSFAQASGAAFYGQEFDINTGAPIGPAVANGAAFTGLEWVGPVLYGTAVTVSGGTSTLRILDPFTGTSVTVGSTGAGPISGLAYNETTEVMYGIAGGPGPANIYTIDLSTGTATVVGLTGFQAGSLEFGQDGNLYGGGTGADSGQLFRVDRSTGAGTLVGATGFESITGLTLREGKQDRDFYQVEVKRGRTLKVKTLTPAAGADEFTNLLDPMIRLYDAAGNLVAWDDNSAADGQNAQLRFMPRRGDEGTYYIEVIGAEGTDGEYLLSIQGNVLQLVAPSADFDDNNVIDGLDFLAWQRGFGLPSPSATKSDGDVNSDLDVDGSDFEEWETQFGNIVGSAVAPVFSKTAIVLPTVASSPLLVDVSPQELIDAAIAWGYADAPAKHDVPPVEDPQAFEEDIIDLALSLEGIVSTALFSRREQPFDTYLSESDSSEIQWLTDELLEQWFG